MTSLPGPSWNPSSVLIIDTTSFRTIASFEHVQCRIAGGGPLVRSQDHHINHQMW